MFQSPTPPQFVTWFHNDKMISYENAADSNSAASSRQAQIVTETGAGDKTHSRLLITDATSAHSGNYTCQASNTEPDSVYVFVSSVGDNIAAIQRQDGSDSIRPCLALLVLLVCLPKLIHW
ncbi:hypothetical protein GE061_008037 [Apolygus lucorum]|uniref:Ig-like domain-containing protein n=1 Tax=Apolygus lucorum TaxID=248454 RepID=A0A8S9WQ32_APOLU|nr:hypothetical protein GE061_008037 [Apolygus lucorum]